MGHFKVSLQVWHNGECFSFADRVYSEPDWAAAHPEVLVQHIMPKLQQQLNSRYGRSIHEAT